MGVIYKLKNEVKDFIISQKQQNPKLGCRKLVDMVNKRFAISASKSSVNSIIKQAGLSSRVGRPKAKNGLRPAAKKELSVLPEPQKSLLIEKKEGIESKEATRLDDVVETVDNKEEEKIGKTQPAEGIIPLVEPEEKKELEILGPQVSVPETKKPGIQESDKFIPEENIGQVPGKNLAKPRESKESGIEPESAKEPAGKIDKQLPAEPEATKSETPKETEDSEFLSEQPQEISEQAPVQQEIPRAAEETGLVKEKKEEAVIPILKPDNQEHLQLEPAVTLPLEQAEEEKEIDSPAQEKNSVPTSEEPIVPVKIDDDEKVDSAGAFFLKAAEWEVFNANVFDGILRGPLQNKSNAAKTDSLIYHSVFGINDLKDIDLYQGKGLWLLNDSLGKFSRAELESFKADVIAKKDTALALHDHIAKGFFLVKKIKFILNDNSVFFIDGQWKTIWPSGNIPAVVNSGVNTVKHCVERMFVDNSSPINIFNISGFKEFSKITFEFLALCENTVEKRIRSVIALGLKEEELFREDVPTALKRDFIIGFWPWQGQAKSFQPFDTKAIKTFAIEELGRQIFYSNFKVDFPNLSVTHRVTFRVMFLRDSEFSLPRIGVLTNIPEEKSPPEEIIRKYVMRWPNFEETYQDLLKKQDPFTMHNFMLKQKSDLIEEEKDDYQLNCSTTDTKENLRFLLRRLNSYAVNHYFPFSYKGTDLFRMEEKFYSLPGKIRRTKDMLIVSLLPAKDYASRSDLLYAVRRVNESGIRDNAFHKLFFKIG